MSWSKSFIIKKINRTSVISYTNLGQKVLTNVCKIWVPKEVENSYKLFKLVHLVWLTENVIPGKVGSIFVDKRESSKIFRSTALHESKSQIFLKKTLFACIQTNSYKDLTNEQKICIFYH